MSHFIKWYLETYVLGCGYSLGNSIEIVQVSFYKVSNNNIYLC